MNVSCPNIKAGGIEFGRDPLVLGGLVKPAGPSSASPVGEVDTHTSDIVALARACADNGADAVSIITPSPEWLSTCAPAGPRSRPCSGACPVQPSSRCLAHGLSGASREDPDSICGIGGIQDGTDAIEFLLAERAVCRSARKASLTQPRQKGSSARLKSAAVPRA